MDDLRVYLVWQHPLLRDTVGAILEQVGLTLVGEARAPVEVADLHATQPDVILMEAEAGIPDHLWAYLPLNSHSRLVTLSLADNTVHIYQQEERVLTQVADLVAALQG